MGLLAFSAGLLTSFAVYYSAKSFSFSKETWTGVMWIMILIFSLIVGAFLSWLSPLLGLGGLLFGFALAFYLGRGTKVDYSVSIKDKAKEDKR